MITKEKFIIRTNLFFRSFFFHLLFWDIAFFLYAFLVCDHSILVNYFNPLNTHSVFIIIAVLGSCIAVFFTFFDAIFSDRFLRFAPIRLLVFLQSISYFALSFIAILLISFRKVGPIISSGNYKEIMQVFPTMDIHFVRFLVFFYLSCFFNNFFKRIVKKVGRGNFKNWVFGLLNKPREEERIFMFIDMKSSTTIAEKLLHKKFSHLVQDIFNDMTVVANYHGEIYQYLGDGAIISWDLKKGAKNNNALNAFYGFSGVIKKREKYYKRRYGLVPEFKAGVHVGKVMVLQVGQIRRDISYSGDTMNTTARIESMCNEYKQNLLISGIMYEKLRDNNPDFTFTNLGNIKLNGKRKAIEIYQVKKINRKQKS